MNEKEKQKIKEYYINTVHPDEKSRNEFIEFINAMPEESAPEYFKPSETMNRMRCTCTPANVNVGREWTIDLDCPRHKHLASQIAKRKFNDEVMKPLSQGSGLLPAHLRAWAESPDVKKYKGSTTMLEAFLLAVANYLDQGGE